MLDIKRIREIPAIIQDAPAPDAGLSKQAKSPLEKKEKTDDKISADVPEISKVPVEAIKNYDEQTVLNVISSTFNDHAVLNGILYNPTFNHFDKVVELYEALLKSEREKIVLLERLLDKK
jgi:predicted O-linked N-acetylglucosamine transferase (SPINDLY family)